MNIFRSIYDFFRIDPQEKEAEAAKLTDQELLNRCELMEAYTRFLDNYSSYPDKRSVIPQIGRFLIQGPAQLTPRQDSSLDIEQISEIEEGFNRLRERYLEVIRKKAG